MTEGDMIFSFMVSKGYHCQAVVVARQELCDDDGEGWMEEWRDHEEGSHIEMLQSRCRLLHHTCACGQQTVVHNRLHVSITLLIKELCFHLLCLSN